MVKVVDKDPKVLIKKPGIKIMSEFSVKKVNQKTNDFRTVFIRCNCDNEILAVRYDYELNLLDLCIYETQSSFKNKMTLIQKIRYIWKLLSTGLPYTDQIVLEQNQIEELKGFLNNL